MVSVGQTAPPEPSASIIYEPPQQSEIKESVFDECGYAISFGGSVVVPNRKDGCVGLSIRRKESLAAFTMIRFSEEDMAKHPLAEIYSRLKEVHGDNGKLGLVGEKFTDWFDGREGIDLSFTDGTRYCRVRAVFKDKVLYKLYIDVTNWNFLNSHHKKIAAAFESEADRFFNSLRLLSK